MNCSRHLKCAALLIIMFCSQVYATPKDDMSLVGSASFRYLFWNVYDAKLYSSDSFTFPHKSPFALELTYARSFSSEALVSETGRQWLKIGEIPEYMAEGMLQELDKLFVDVSKGDVLTLFVDDFGCSHFYLNNKILGSISDTSFSYYFSSIWLSEKTTRPVLRAELIGSNP